MAPRQRGLCFGSSCARCRLKGRPLQAGTPYFLEEGELTASNCFINFKVRAMWKDAAEATVRMPSGETYHRALCLNVTTPGVTTRGGIEEQANLLLDAHPSAISVVVSGSCIKWRTGHPSRPGDGNWCERNTYRGKQRKFDDILEEIDRRYADRPVFVFGYSQMVRGISYRSAHRAPSHMILLYGKMKALGQLVQAGGRANGDFCRVLNRNGFDRVKILTKANDFGECALQW